MTGEAAPPEAVFSAQAALLEACRTWDRGALWPLPIEHRQQASLCEIADGLPRYSAQSDALTWAVLSVLVLSILGLYVLVKALISNTIAAADFIRRSTKKRA